MGGNVNNLDFIIVVVDGVVGTDVVVAFNVDDDGNVNVLEGTTNGRQCFDILIDNNCDCGPDDDDDDDSHDARIRYDGNDCLISNIIIIRKVY